ncbi:glycosyltransferase [Candidatus Peregrinibacteria bacterium]|nr:glycosyltransferase [Candidatus Peregrinibacteria bacterium]
MINKIGIDGRYLNKPFTGIGKYTSFIVYYLAKNFPNTNFVVAMPDYPNENISSKFKDLKNVYLIKLNENALLEKISKGLSKSYYERKTLKKFFEEQACDSVLIPYPSLYRDNDRKVVMTVHDTIPWTNQEYNRGLKSKLYHQSTLKNLKHVDHILTVSETSKKDLVRNFKIKESKITVTSNAFENVNYRQLGLHERLQILKKYEVDISRPFIFYIGGFDPRKNVSRLIKLHQRHLRKKGYNLVLGGCKVLGNKFYDSIEDANKAKDVFVTGFIEEDDMLAFFMEAKAYITLTKAEGFNMPLLESITNQCLTFVSDLDVHREVAKDYAIFLDLKSSNKKLSEEILKVLKSKNLYADWKSKLKRFKSPYNGNYTAEKTFDILK